MDRDVVNALHYLYLGGRIEWEYLAKCLWCGPDSQPILDMFVKRDGKYIEMPSELMSFLKSVESQMDKLPKPDFVFGFPFKLPIRGPNQPRNCFVAMPYGPNWFESVRNTIKTAATASGFEPLISGDLATPGDITDQIWFDIRKSEAVIADITGNNPNVFYEIGIAHSLGKEVIIIVQPDGNIPFDIRNSRRISYDVQVLSKLESDLCQAFDAVAPRYQFEGPQPRF